MSSTSTSSTGEVFCACWKFVSCDNFDAFLKEIGIPLPLRKLALLMSPNVIICKSESSGAPGDLWTIKTETAVKSAIAHFELNKSFSETTIDGRVVESHISLDLQSDGVLKMVHIQKDQKGRESRIERIVKGNFMHVLMTANNVVSTALFKKAS